jgi:predicted DNA-binding transcriptional regulator AlpA
MVEQFLKEKQAAELMNCSRLLLWQYRLKGIGPRFIKLGPRLVRYALSDVVAFMEAGKRQSTKSAGTD